MPNSIKKMFIGAALLAGAVAMGGCTAHVRGAVYVPGAPPDSVRETVIVSPGGGYIWIDGYHRWDGGHYVWVGGRWEQPPRARARWVKGHWRHSRRGWYWTDGRWR